MFARLAEFARTLDALAILLMAGLFLAGVMAVAGLYRSCRRRARGREREGHRPLVVGRTVSCSLCDTTFSLPIAPGEWVRCPGCQALVRV